MSLTTRQSRHLRGLAHHLSPVVHVGAAGVTDAVIAKVADDLLAHELIKVKCEVEDREHLAATAAALAERSRSELVQVIGHTVILYRARKEKPTIVLPKKAT